MKKSDSRSLVTLISCSSKLFSGIHFSSKNHQKSVSGRGGNPPGGKKCLSGGLGLKIPSKARFGGDFKAKLGPKLGVKILLLC